MNSILDRMGNTLQKVSESFAKNITLNIISSGFLMLLPITLVGCFCSLFRGFPIDAYQKWLQSTPIDNLLGAAYQFTMGLFGIYVVLAVGYQFAQKKKMRKDSLFISLTALMAYLIATPYDLKGNAISFEWLGATGTFSACIVAFITGYVFYFCKKYDIRIRMPKEVPANVMSSFSAIIPVAIVMIIFMIVKYLFGLTSFGCIHACIYSILALPLQSVAANPFGTWIILTFSTLCWWFGIHGAAVTYPISMAIFTPLTIDNLTAYQAGAALPHSWVGTTLVYGRVLGMVLCVLLFAKSKRLRSTGNVTLIPAIFDVLEPAYFGFPMVLNPLFLIPMLLSVTINVFASWGLTAIGILPYANGVSVAFNCPFGFIIQNIMVYGGIGAVIGTLLTALDILIYYPFVKAFDNQCLKEENENKEHIENV